MRLHILGIPHTVCNDSFSSCAFTGKTARLSPMMRPFGFETIYYGVQGMQSGATIDVEVMSTEEHLAHLRRQDYHDDPSRLVGVDGNDGTSLYHQFNYNLRQELKDRLEPGDIVCVPFGGAHERAYRTLPLVQSKQVAVMETGIGYPQSCTYYRVFESEAWRHYYMGRDHRFGQSFASPRLEWVIPNYYDLTDWPLGTARDMQRVVYFGRLESCKGVEIVPWLAERRPDLHFILCGQGDPSPFLGAPNVEYQTPIRGKDRAAFLGSARAALCPSRYLEPFCGSAVEAMLSGTAVIASDFGAFTENVKHGVTGYRCRTREAFLKALDDVLLLNPAQIRRSTAARYSLQAVGPKYAIAFEEVAAAIRPLVHA